MRNAVLDDSQIGRDASGGLAGAEEIEEGNVLPKEALEVRRSKALRDAFACPAEAEDEEARKNKSRDCYGQERELANPL